MKDISRKQTKWLQKDENRNVKKNFEYIKMTKCWTFNLICGWNLSGLWWYLHLKERVYGKLIKLS